MIRIARSSLEMLSGSDTADFPDRLSPIFVRDLRQGLRAHYFVWVFILLQLLSLISTLVEFALVQVIGESAQGGALSGAQVPRISKSGDRRDVAGVLY